MKKPKRAAVLSLLFAGLGQMYNGQVGKGVLFIVVQIINILLIPMYIGFVTFPLTLGFAVHDAYRVAKIINLEAEHGEDTSGPRHRERAELHE